jgi:type VI protein secretion system component VasK
MLAFLNRAQTIDAAFFSKGAQPQLTYSLRPKLEGFQDSTFELEVDGQLHQWASVLQKQFTWPAASGVKPGAVARIRTRNVAYAFATHGGLWGIFRFMGDAETRPLSSTIVEWKHSIGGDPIQPGPVRLEFPELPNGTDVFNPKFFEDFTCPKVAVR